MENKSVISNVGRNYADIEIIRFIEDMLKTYDRSMQATEMLHLLPVGQQRLERILDRMLSEGRIIIEKVNNKVSYRLNKPHEVNKLHILIPVTYYYGKRCDNKLCKCIKCSIHDWIDKAFSETKQEQECYKK